MDTVKTVETPYNNAVAILNRTNELLNENNIMDSTGAEIAQLEQNVANPAWLFALACGSLHTSWQEQIAKAYACLDPQNCEDDQVLVLAALAGIKRGNGTPSHITVRLTNTDTSNSVTVPIGTEFAETYCNKTWVLNKSVTLSPEAYQYVTLYTTDDGEFSVPSETTFNYDGDLTISCVSVSVSSGGSEIETLASLRNRISQGEDTSNSLNQAKTAIELLSGIESCSIWFNTSSTNSLTVGSDTKSRISVIIENTSEDESVTVPYGTSFTETVTNNTWVLNDATEIETGGQKIVTLYSQNNGDFTVPAGTVFSYSGNLDISCTAYEDSVAGSVTIPPRTAYVSIKGYDYSGKLAETYFTYLDVPATVGDNESQYVVGQQELSVNFDYSREYTVQVYVTMKSADMAVGAEGAIKKAITAYSGTLACGENVTSQMISEWIQNLGYGTVVGCNVNTQTGLTSQISPTEFAVFDEDHITVLTV